VKDVLRSLSTLLPASEPRCEALTLPPAECPAIRAAAAAFHLYAQQQALDKLQAAEAGTSARQAPPSLPKAEAAALMVSLDPFAGSLSGADPLCFINLPKMVRVLPP
jgi:hypothetical protein